MKAKPFEGNPLLRNLVDKPDSKSRKKNKLSFVAALQKLGVESVFDIIRQPKAQFVERLGVVCDADGAQAYDNAMCYAVQIGRLYRNHRTSSGQEQSLTQRSGVRALLDIGASYQREFQENWDSFCKVGAIAAHGSPVAYGSHLYYLATQVLEVEGQGTTAKITLDTRRPDIGELLIDQQSTFTSRPMLEQVNEVLSGLIKGYLHGTPQQNTPIYEVLANRRHPFIFPYHFAHHQCRLGMAGKKPELGELNYRISRQLPLSQRPANDYGTVQTTVVEAQRLLSGLSPQQQQLLIEPSLFTTFYLSRTQLVQPWLGPVANYLSAYTAQNMGMLILSGQPAVRSVTPPAVAFSANSGLTNVAVIECSKPGVTTTKPISLSLRSGAVGNSSFWTLNFLHLSSNAYERSINLRILGHSAAELPPQPGYSGVFTVTRATGPTATATPVYLSAQSFTLVLDEFFQLSADQQLFFKNSYGLTVGTTAGAEELIELKCFMAQTGINAEQVEELLSQRTHAPRLSANCPVLHPSVAANPTHPRFYGACYVNGHGSDRYDSVQPPTAASIRADQYDNAMGLKEVSHGESKTWYLTKTSLNRFDRLQRKIRLQRWMDIPAAELDTLLISAIRSEGSDNLGMDLNVNTLRVLGIYRYLSKRYSIKPEEFAALLHDLTPYATGDRVPLFDQVFNTPVLFDTPLRLVQTAFTLTNPNLEAKKTLAQLCAGLGLQPTSESLLRLATQTQTFVGPLKRDLATVSSIYRQARVARLFGLSTQESWGLLDVLGGTEYQRLLCRGTLASASVSRESVLLQAFGPGMGLQLVLHVDPSESGGNTLLLQSGSGLVASHDDFATPDRERIFEFVGHDTPVIMTGFLKNADGTVLTLDAFTGGTTFENKRVTRAAWQSMTQTPSGLATLRVKCGKLAFRDLTVLSVTYNPEPPPAPDILDVLMQMDWWVSFLKDTRQSVGGVRRLLGLEAGDYLPRKSLIDRVGQLLEATRSSAVTDEQILTLNLPTGHINWREELLPLLDVRGLVTPLPMLLFENTLAQLRQGLWLIIDPLSLPPQVKAECVEKLANLLLAAHDRQLRVIEGVAQELVNLPMDRTQVVVRWAQTTVYALLSAVLESGSDGAVVSGALLDPLQRVLRYAEAALHLRLSTAALRLFLARPEWLGGALGSNLVLSLQTFYLLSRYSAWFNGQSQSEEALLGYFILANPGQAQLKNKALRNAVNDEAASALASLMGWSKEEIKALCETLTLKRACTMAEIDWLFRCKQASADSGLSAADLLRATALHAQSSSADWQAMGEAAMAASR